MRTLTKRLIPLLMLAVALPGTLKAQDLSFTSSTEDLNDTIPLGSRINIEWQLSNDGNNAVPENERVAITLTVGGDSVNGLGFSSLPLPPGQSVPGNNNLSAASLTEFVEPANYSEGNVEVCLIVSNQSDSDNSNDTLCQTVFLKDVNYDLGVSEIITDVSNVFRDSLETVRLAITNNGSTTLRSGVEFPIRTTIDFSSDAFLDTFQGSVSFQDDLQPGGTDTAQISFFVGPSVDTGTYTYTARTAFGSGSYSVDPNTGNDTQTTAINVDFKYNIEPRFTGLSDGDTVLRGSRFSYGVNLFNQGPGLVQSFEVQDQDGNDQVLPFVIDDANIGVNENFQPRDRIEGLGLNSTLPVGQALDIFGSDAFSTRLPANDDRDSITLSFYHQARVPSQTVLALDQRPAFASIADTSTITLYVADKTFDIGVSNVKPLGDTIQKDSTNAFEVTIQNSSGEAITSKNQIPVNAHIPEVDFSTSQLVRLDQNIPANGSVTDTINVDLRQAENGTYTFGMETQWDVNRYQLDENPANDSSTVEITIGSPEGLAEASLVQDANVYPNPADDNARLSYTLKQAKQLTITLTNVAGRQLRVLQQGYQASGRHELNFRVNDLDAGTYFYQIRTQEGRQTGKLIVK